MESYQVNKINKDDFGRVSGVFAYNKPVGVSSHDIVYKFRRHFETKKVGHAGTLDPFADGLLMILVGKATKLSDQFLNKDKEYKARILFGLETTSGDPEGEIIKTSTTPIDLNKSKLEEILKEFTPTYNQSVPLFSSVKVGGKKLRELARQYSSFEFEFKDGNTFVNFFNKNKEAVNSVQLPSKEVNIYNIEAVNYGSLDKTEIIKVFKEVYGNRSQTVDESQFKLDKYQYVDIVVSVSKGTYIRQLAIDIGAKLNNPAMLIALTRTKIGEISIENTYKIEEAN